MRRILILSSSYPFHRSDFHARFVHEQAAAFAAAGLQVRVLTPRTPEVRDPAERWDGVEVERFPFPGWRSRVWSPTGRDGLLVNCSRSPLRAAAVPGLLCAFVRATRAQLAAWRPDAIVTHWLVPGAWAASVALRHAPIPALHLAHSSDVHLLRSLPGGRRIARAIARSGSVVATSGFLQRRIAELLPARSIALLPLGVAQGSAPARAPRGAIRRLCYLGRLVPGKGLDQLLDAIAALPGCTLSIAGDGAERQRLEARARRERLPVAFVGPVVDEAKRRFLLDHDLFVFLPAPSGPDAFQDNLPIALIEALAAGMPALCTRVGAIPELLGGGGGLLLPSGDPRSVASAIASLSPARYAALSREATAVAERFAWSRHVTGAVALLAGLGEPAAVPAVTGPVRASDACVNA